MFNEEGERIGRRYTVSYKGYLFDGDSDDPDAWNTFETDSWDEITIYMTFYPEQVYISDNEYDVSWHDGEWY